MGNDTLHCPRQFAENSRLYLISSSSTDLQHNARALTFAKNCSTVLYQVSQTGPRCSKVFRTAPRCFYTFNQKSNACSTMARAWGINLRETQSLSKLGFRARLKRSEVCWALVALNGLEEGILWSLFYAMKHKNVKKMMKSRPEMTSRRAGRA